MLLLFPSDTRRVGEEQGSQHCFIVSWYRVARKSSEIKRSFKNKIKNQLDGKRRNGRRKGMRVDPVDAADNVVVLHGTKENNLTLNLSL